MAKETAHPDPSQSDGHVETHAAQRTQSWSISICHIGLYW
jgi:hypothetical protein